jgi:hypothetical protein
MALLARIPIRTTGTTISTDLILLIASASFRTCSLARFQSLVAGTGSCVAQSSVTVAPKRRGLRFALASASRRSSLARGWHRHEQIPHRAGLIGLK